MSPRLRLVAAGVAVLAYLTFSQWLMTRSPPSAWSAVALLTPMLALVAVGTWRSGRRAWSVLAFVVAATLALQAATGGGIAPQHLYVTENVAVHLALATVFGSTLRPGSRPLIQRLATRVHRQLTADMERYTRKVTLAWTLYFSAMASVSVLLYALTPFTLWATFANVVTPLALVAMFAGEFMLRYRLHPEFERATMQDAIRAYSQVRREVAAPAAGDPPP
jgi:uncharacterized membrane protein